MTKNLIPSINISLQKDGFFGDVLKHLSGILQDTVGLEDASGFISVVGQRVGDELNNQYKTALSLDNLNREQVSSVLVDLKQRIGGNFEVVLQTDEKIVLRTTSCPFGDKVVGRPSLCMMTSNVFGVIAADNLGYAKVELQETIAKGDSGCKVVIYLNDNEQTSLAQGIDYYQG